MLGQTLPVPILQVYRVAYRVIIMVTFMQPRENCLHVAWSTTRATLPPMQVESPVDKPDTTISDTLMMAYVRKHNREYFWVSNPQELYHR